ncbi:MAG: hypothetical protein WAV89_01300 [Ignavibacteriaceae bacterium]
MDTTVYPVESIKNGIQFSVNFSKSGRLLFKNYNKFIIYSALVAVSLAGSSINSSTIAGEFINNENSINNFIQV